MKRRNKLVSNSSSASFIVKTENLSPTLKRILSNPHVINYLLGCPLKPEKEDCLLEFQVEIRENEVEIGTGYDDCTITSWLESLGIEWDWGYW